MSCFLFRIENWFGFAAMYMIKDCGDHWIFYQGKIIRIDMCVGIFLFLNLSKLFIGIFSSKYKADFGQKAFEKWMAERPTWWATPHKFSKNDRLFFRKSRIPPEIGLGFLSNDIKF